MACVIARIRAVTGVEEKHVTNERSSQLCTVEKIKPEKDSGLNRV